MCLVIYDENDSIITVLDDARSINAFLKGYYDVMGAHHYEFN
jgi:hypothetical protein